MTREEEITVSNSIKAIAEMLFQAIDVQWLLIETLRKNDLISVKDAFAMRDRVKAGSDKISSITERR